MLRTVNEIFNNKKSVVDDKCTEVHAQPCTNFRIFSSSGYDVIFYVFKSFKNIIHTHESCDISTQHTQFNYTVTTYFEMFHYFLNCNHVPVPNGELSGNMLTEGSRQLLECDLNHGENAREIRECTTGQWQPDSTCTS